MSPTKRVAILRTDLLPISETFVRDQVAALSGWQPVLVGRREVEGGLETPGIPREIVPETSSPVMSAMRFWLSRPDPPLVERLRALEVDLVHAHFGIDATDAWPSVRAAGLPMVVTLHGYDINIHRAWWEAGHQGLRRRFYPRRLLQMAREPGVRFVAVSRAIQRQAIAYGIPEGKILASPIGVDVARFTPGGLPMARRRRRIVFVGRMVEKKAPLLMVRVFAEVRKEVLDAELVMIGDGPLLAAARALARTLAMPVVFLGPRPSQEVRDQMNEARAFCLPSVTAANGDAEGFGMVLLEAQACGVPVVTSARGGAEDGLVHGETGFACGEGATRELAEALCSLLRDDVLAENASRAAASFVRAAFDIRKGTADLERIYDDSMSTPV